MNSFDDRNTLPQELVRELFIYDDGKLLWRKPGKGITVGENAGWKSFSKTHNNFRWVIYYKGKHYKRSVLVWIYHHGNVPEDRLVDHRKSEEILNDRIENLRLATHEENSKNRKKHRTYKGKPTSSNYKGVCRNKNPNKKNTNKWQAYIRVKKDGKACLVYLGGFATEEEAYAAYVVEAKLHHGDFFNPG
jgi:hypothetical protein